jgi:tyrosinase
MDRLENKLNNEVGILRPRTAGNIRCWEETMTTTDGRGKASSSRRQAMSGPRPVTFADLLEPSAVAAAAAAVPLRKDQATLSVEERGRFLDGIKLLNQRGIFSQLVSIHSDMSHTMHDMGPGDPTSPLGQQRFLPWHRVFLSQLEQQLQGFYPEVTIPYWDWTKPDEQSVPEWLRHLVLTVNVQVPIPMDGLVSPVVVNVERAPLSQQALAQAISPLDAVMLLTNYTDFATGLERVHNGVHVWVGGTMYLLETAAADPLFWMHHANIDRLWWQWQQSPAGKDQNPTLTGTDAIMDPWRYDEPLTRDIANFNYAYG